MQINFSSEALCIGLNGTIFNSASLLEMKRITSSGSLKKGMVKKNRDNDECLAELRSRWQEIILNRFDYFYQKSPGSKTRMEMIADTMLQGLESLFLEFSELKDTQFNKQILLPYYGKYSQRMAEMLFYYQLLKMGFDKFDSDDEGPDFVAEKNGQIFCFEVVTPTPEPSLRELIQRRELKPEERDQLFRERLLLVTSAISGKLKQLEAHKAGGYVPEGAHYIIVVNDSLLLPYDQPWHGVLAELCFGDSTLPIAVDATLGSADIDFSELFGQPLTVDEGDSFQGLVMKSNFGISINGAGPVFPEDSTLGLRIRQEIPTKKYSDTVLVDIAESAGASGVYQITLREDLMFYHSFEARRSTNPPSALISSVENKVLLRESISYSSTYAKGEDLVQPHMSPARLFGYEPDEFNNTAVYNELFKPYL